MRSFCQHPVTRRNYSRILFFFFNDTATTEIYTLSLHALFRSPLAQELRRVHADDGELLAPLALELPQLRKDVQAVDSAEGPEVEQDQLAVQVAEGERAPGVEPVGVGREIGCVDPAGEPLRHPT